MSFDTHIPRGSGHGGGVGRGGAAAEGRWKGGGGAGGGEAAVNEGEGVVDVEERKVEGIVVVLTWYSTALPRPLPHIPSSSPTPSRSLHYPEPTLLPIIALNLGDQRHTSDSMWSSPSHLNN